MCRLYGVTRGYYAWCGRRPCARTQHTHLLGQVRALHAAHDGNYGSPRVHGALSGAATPVWTTVPRHTLRRKMPTGGVNENG